MPSKDRKKPGPHSRKKIRALKGKAAEIDAQRLAEVAELQAEVARLKGKPAEPPAPKPAPPPPPLSLTTLGAPPEDSLGAQYWAHRATILTMHETMNDATLTPRDRAKEMRALAAAAAKLMPDSRRWEAEQLIRQDREEIERKARLREGAKLEPRPPRTPREGADATSS